jgi:hypothetical protein
MAKSMGYNMAGGLQGMLKDGHTSFEGVDEAIMRNIDAAKQLADIVKTSLGPNGKCCSLTAANALAHCSMVAVGRHYCHLFKGWPSYTCS